MPWAVFLILISICSGVSLSGESTLRNDIDSLRAEVLRLQRLYYQEGKSEVSDPEYDALVARLRELESEKAGTGGQSDLLTIPIGDDRQAGFAKEKHHFPMRSLNKVMDPAELILFHNAVDARLGTKSPSYCIEPKVDGVAISLVYEHGVLVHALSRGDGREGDVLTRQLQEIGIPRRLPIADGDAEVPALVELRGEVYVEREDFSRINTRQLKDGELPFATPRSLAAGCIRSRDGAFLREKFLRCVLFDWGAWLPTRSRPMHYTEFKERLRNWGLPVLETCAGASTGDDLQLQATALLDACRNNNMPCDGVVVKVEDSIQRDELGFGEQAPNWAIACKFPGCTGQGQVLGIHLQIGRTGKITPVAEIEPLSLNGRVVRRVNLHSPGFVQSMDVRVGDRVTVTLSGDVIPVIQKVELSEGLPRCPPFSFPDLCPACSALLIKGDAGETVSCPNYACQERTKRRLEYFARQAGLIGVGPAAIDALVNSGKVTTYADLLLYFKNSDSAALMPDLGRILAGLGIPGVGPGLSRDLAAEIRSFVCLLDLDATSLQAAGVPMRKARSIETYVVSPETRSELLALWDLLSIGISDSEIVETEPDSPFLPNSIRQVDDRRASSR